MAIRSALITFIIVAITVLASGCGIERGVSEARDSAAAFHENFRKHTYDVIYADASERFRSVRSKDQYVSMMNQIHNQYGDLLETNEVSNTLTFDAATGKVVVLVFRARFQNATALERLTFVRDPNGKTRLWMFELS